MYFEYATLHLIRSFNGMNEVVCFFNDIDHQRPSCTNGTELRKLQEKFMYITNCVEQHFYIRSL